MSNQLKVIDCCAPTIASDIRVRAARAGDLDAVASQLRKAKLPDDGVTQHFPDGYAVAEHAGHIVGAAGVETYGEDGLLRSVVVDAVLQQRGLGQQLVHDRLRWARDQQLRDVYLLTTTAPTFFAKLGFEPVVRDTVPNAVAEAEEFALQTCSTATVMKLSLASGTDVRAAVRAHYGEAARAAANGEAASCACCGGTKTAEWNPITSDLYEDGDTAGIPAKALLASLGCGNPTALAELKPGEVVLDLGSGGGIDVLLSAKRVGPTGKAYGLDMTDDMLELARENQRAAGVDNVEFLKGEIENIPLPDASVDVIISNCVINLSADKGIVLKEAYRVLKPGGRFAVSDIVVRGEMPEAVKRKAELWSGCVSGALEEREYQRLLSEAGFVGADIEATRVYDRDDMIALAGDTGVEVTKELAQLEGKFISAFVRARRP